MADRLQSLGFELVGGKAHVDVSRREMALLLGSLEDLLLVNSSDVETTALFYYSGHGVAVADDNRLVPVDDEAIFYREDVPDFAIGARSVIRRLEDRGEGLNILILDACRNNPLPSRRKTKGSLSKGLSPIDAPSNTVIAYAAAPGRVAYDGAGILSPFTGALVEEMVRPGKRLVDVLGATAAAVEHETARLPEGRQEPWLEMRPPKRPFYFAPVETPSVGAADALDGSGNGADREGSVKRLATERVFWKTVVGSKKSSDFDAYLERYPGGVFAQLATNRRNELRILEDDAAFADADALGTVEAYEIYLKLFPSGRSAEAAEQRLRFSEFIGRKFSADAVTRQGWTDLHYAAVMDLPSVANALLKSGLDVDVRLEEQNDGSFEVALRRRLMALGFRFKYPLGQEYPMGETALILASRYGSKGMINYWSNAAPMSMHATPVTTHRYFTQHGRTRLKSQVS